MGPGFAAPESGLVKNRSKFNKTFFQSNFNFWVVS